MKNEWADSNRESTIDPLDHAGNVLQEIMAAPDKGIPEEVLEHARCVPAPLPAGTAEPFAEFRTQTNYSFGVEGS
jgi:hypothetical protein